MKKILNALAIGLAGGLGVGVLDASADLEVSAGVQIRAATDFYTPLAASGSWIDVGSHGRCWRPAHVAVGWRPYCEGDWVWTDCGWYWESDEPWAWACYHYGGWVYDASYGWVWAPGVEWAPAWVSWRVGGGFIGWAPLGPGGVFLGAQLAIGTPFVFIDAVRFHDRIRPATVIVNNTTIINKTTQITNIKRETRTLGTSGSRQVMVNEGPGVAVVQSATGHRVEAVPIRVAALKTPVPPSVAHQAPAARQEQPPAVHEQPRPIQAQPKSTPERAAPTPAEHTRPVPKQPQEHRDPPPPARPAPAPPTNGRHGNNQGVPAPQQPPRVVPSHGGPPAVPHGNGQGGEHGGHEGH